MKAKALCATLAFAALSAAAHADPISVQRGPGVEWACGGVGAEERQALRALQGGASAVLTFTEGRRGGYVADVGLSVAQAGAQAPLLKLEAAGPICVLWLAPGEYRLVAARGAAVRSSAFRVTAGAAAPVGVGVSFPGEPWDGIRASDEEKRQARE